MLALAAGLPILGAVGAQSLLANVDVATAVFARAQASAGTAPLEPGADPEPITELELRPGVGLRLRTPHTLTILRAEPRFLYRIPNIADLDRPLFLLRADVTHNRELSARTTSRTAVSASLGEIDYMSAQLAFGASPSRAITEPVLRLFDVDGSNELTFRTSEANTLTLSLNAGYTTLASQEATEQFPETVYAGASATRNWQLDPTATLSLPVGAERYFVRPGADWLVVSTGLGYGQELDQRTHFDAEAGLSAYKVDDDPSWQPLPTGLLALERVLFQRPSGRVSGRASVAFDALYDPTVGEIFPTAALELSWAARSDRGWGATLALNGQTSFGTPAEESAPGAPPQGSTYVSGVSSVDYELARGLRTSGGLRISARGSDLGANDFRFFDRQTFVFVALTAAFGLARNDEGAWAL